MAFNFIAYGLFWEILFSSVFCSQNSSNVMMGETAFFSPTDASDIKWAHAVNSHADLEKELAGQADFLEVDIILGQVNKKGPKIAITAHPPQVSSDISLDKWMETVTHRNTGKGLKLDFKSLDVVESSFKIIQKYAHKMNSTLWINADILHGPIHPKTVPVKHDVFLLLCHQYFPKSTLSVGWTTDWYSTYPPESWNYEWKQIRKMVDTIRCFGYENRYPPFTFPVRGIYASRSIRKLQWLMDVVPGSSLTVWSHSKDPLELEDLLKIRRSFPVNKVYYDVPIKVLEPFLNVKNSTSHSLERPSTFKEGEWMTLTQGQSSDCTSHTYIGNNTIVFGKSLTTAILLKTQITVDDHYSLRAEGGLEFFSSYDDISNSLQLNQATKLTIVLVDVSLFSKNSSSGSLDLTKSDTDVLWAAVNASPQLYTFEQIGSNDCRMFQLDTDEEMSFQAWTVPCEEKMDGKPFKDIVKNGVPEVSFKKRLVISAGKYMIGFVAVGNNHAIIHDFEISNTKSKSLHSTSSSSIISISLVSLAVVILSVLLPKLMK